MAEQDGAEVVDLEHDSLRQPGEEGALLVRELLRGPAVQLAIGIATNPDGPVAESA